MTWLVHLALRLLLQCISAEQTHRTEIPRVSWTELQNNPSLSKSFVNSPAIITDTPLHDWVRGKYKDTENRKPWLWLQEHMDTENRKPWPLGFGTRNFTVKEQVESTVSGLDHTNTDWAWVDYHRTGDFTFFNDRRQDRDPHQPTKWTENTPHKRVFDIMRCDAGDPPPSGSCGLKFQMTTFRLANKRQGQEDLNGDKEMHMPPAAVMQQLQLWLKSIDPVLARQSQPVKIQDTLFWSVELCCDCMLSLRAVTASRHCVLLFGRCNRDAVAELSLRTVIACCHCALSLGRCQ